MNTKILSNALRYEKLFQYKEIVSFYKVLTKVAPEYSFLSYYLYYYSNKPYDVKYIYLLGAIIIDNEPNLVFLTNSNNLEYEYYLIKLSYFKSQLLNDDNLGKKYKFCPYTSLLDPLLEDKEKEVIEILSRTDILDDFKKLLENN